MNSPVSAQRPAQCPVQSSTQWGFTLIEISVVLLLVGIITTFLVLSIGSRPLDDRMHNEAERLRQLMGLAADEAQLKGVQIGLQLGSDGYRFLRLNDSQQWVVYDSDGPLRPRRLPKPFTLSLHIEGHAIKAADLQQHSNSDDSDSSDSDKKKIVPQILILSSGEMTAFKLDLGAPHQLLYYELSADALGRLKLKQETDSR